MATEEDTPAPKRRNTGQASDTEDTPAPKRRNSGQTSDTSANRPLAIDINYLRLKEQFLKDDVSLGSYQAAITHHKEKIAGKVVLDVCCGTGVLSILCAQAGARRVYAIESSNLLFEQAKALVKANNFSEVITVLEGLVEDVEISEEADVIIASWMGYMLMRENTLPSLVFARNHWLKSDGLIIPSYAQLVMAPVTSTIRYKGFNGENIHGIDLSPIKRKGKKIMFGDPSVELVSEENVLAGPQMVKIVDCLIAVSNELDSLEANFKFVLEKKGSLCGFAFWFSVNFGFPKQESNDIELSTSPFDPPTHWQQTVIYLDDPIDLDANKPLEGSLQLSQRVLTRKKIQITFNVKCVE